jgi:adenine-specific DNA-methyltransferase
MPSATDADQVQDLSRDELLERLELLGEGGIHIDFAGKTNARRLSRLVRPRIARIVKKHSAGPAEEQARNLLVEGDNLQAMATLYRERGQIDLILTDPPYNTGNDWRYNDKWDEDPNDPGVGEWVSGDDGSRHTKWMRFMWPRLAMMRSMLKPGGVLAICIDHRELFRLGQMLDELFKEENRLAIINWQKATAVKNANDHVSTSTEYVLVYAKDEKLTRTGLLERSASQNSRYSNPDGDPRQDWREGMLAARDLQEKDFYAIQSPFTGDYHYPQGSSHWRHPKRDIKSWLEEWGSPYAERSLDDGRVKALVLADGFSPKVKKAAERVLKAGPWPFIWFGRSGNGIPRKKIYLAEVKQGKIPETFWADEAMSEDEDASPDELGSTSWEYQESGRSSDGAAELTAILGTDHGFETVKPLKLFKKLITIWCPPQGSVLDPFAGSGTTGHAVLDLNEATDASRRFLLIEQGRPDRGDSYARSLTSERLKRAISGDWAAPKGPSPQPLGGGFRFVSLGKKVDAEALLSMEREELTDTIIGSHFDPDRRRRESLVTFPSNPKYQYLVARNVNDEGFFLIWNGANGKADFDEAVYEACAAEAKRAKLAPRYHVYARLYLYQTNNVIFYQIPDRILADFGLDIRGEPYHEASS